MAGDSGCEGPEDAAKIHGHQGKDGETHMWREVIQQVLISEAELQRRIQALGQAITADYQGQELLLVPVLKGALLFAADLARAIDLPLTLDCVSLSSYGDSHTSSGQVSILKDLSESITGKHVLIIEDIIDTGLTLQYLWHRFMDHRPADLHVCTLLDKRARRQVELPIRYRGFDIPDAFVVGYGLDYQQRYRNLPFIGTLRAEAFSPGLRETCRRPTPQALDDKNRV
jgi:hypoxanthine phosphoribosyltransferase